MHYDDLLDTVTQVAVDTLSQPATRADGVVVHGFFDNAWTDPALGQIDAAILEPSIRLRQADVAGLQVGDTLTINARVYHIVRIIRGESPGLLRVVLK